MAEPTHQVPFTVGDQERLKGIEDKLDKVCGLLSDPMPRCAANMERIRSLETSRKKWQYASGSIVIGLVLYTVKLIVSHLTGS